MDNCKQSCCVCLKNNTELNELSKDVKNNVSLQSKLETIIPEIEWLTRYLICDPCTNFLGIAYTFRETCIKSDDIRKRQVLDGYIIKSESSYIKYEENEFQMYVKLEDNEGEMLDDEINAPNYSDKGIKEVKVEITEEENIASNYSNKEIKEVKLEITEECSQFQTDVKDKDDDTETFNDDNNDPNYSAEEIKDVNVDITKEDAPPPKRRKVYKFQCEKCPNNHYTVSTALIKHCIQDHGMENKDVRPFTCTICDRRFRSSSNLTLHIAYHEAVRSYICTYCGKGFITKGGLTIHQKQHLNKREYKCELCIKSFNTPSELRAHKLLKHSDPQLWRYSCEICLKRFPMIFNYYSHMRRHTGDKKFKCSLCTKCFVNKCELDVHMRVHSDVRDFKCSECDKAYKDKKTLRIHMAKIHGIGVGKVKLPSTECRFMCHICPNMYVSDYLLTRHLYAHAGEKPYSCRVCHQRFNNKYYVKQHMKKFHDIKSDSNTSILIT